MKSIILLLLVCALSCNNKEDDDLKKARQLIESQKKTLYLDSISSDQQMKREIAEDELKEAKKN